MITPATISGSFVPRGIKPHRWNIVSALTAAPDLWSRCVWAIVNWNIKAEEQELEIVNNLRPTTTHVKANGITSDLGVVHRVGSMTTTAPPPRAWESVSAYLPAGDEAQTHVSLVRADPNGTTADFCALHSWSDLSSSNNYIELAVRASEGAIVVRAGSFNEKRSGINIISDGQWHLVAGEWDGSSTMRVYVDGVDGGTGSASAPSGLDTFAEWTLGRGGDLNSTDTADYWQKAYSMIFRGILTPAQHKLLALDRFAMLRPRVL